VAPRFRYQFAWDPAKAHDNLAKPDIVFEQAVTVFRDPLAVTVYQPSAAEERWATLGRSESGALLVVIHTFSETSTNSAVVRIISARRATKQEVGDYEGPAR
jgi:uncharacterized protein